MEAGANARSSITFEFLLDPALDDVSLRPDAEPRYFEQARSDLIELEAELRQRVDRAERPFGVSIDSVELRRGSILVDVWMTLNTLGAGLVLYGNLRQGINELANDLRAVCQAFLRRFFPGHLRVGTTTIAVGPPIVLVPPPRRHRLTRIDLQTYLIASHAVLMVALIAIVIVLLTRTG